MGFKMKGNPMSRNFGIGSPLNRNMENRIVNGVNVDAMGKPVATDKKESNAAFKYSTPAKTPLYYHKDGHTDKNDGNNDGNDDQSKEAAIKRGDVCGKCGKLKGNCTCKKSDLKDLRSNDKNVDLDKGENMPVKKSGFGPTVNGSGQRENTKTKKTKSKKVMNDGPKTNVSGVKNPGNWQPSTRVKSDAEKKSIAKKKEFDAMTPEQKQAAQDKANDKADKFHKRGKYKVTE